MIAGPDYVRCSHDSRFAMIWLVLQYSTYEQRIETPTSCSSHYRVIPNRRLSGTMRPKPNEAPVPGSSLKGNIACLKWTRIFSATFGSLPWLQRGSWLCLPKFVPVTYILSFNISNRITWTDINETIGRRWIYTRATVMSQLSGIYVIYPTVSLTPSHRV